MIRTMAQSVSRPLYSRALDSVGDQLTWSGQRAYRSSIPGRSKIFCCFSKCPDRPQGPRFFLFNGTGGILSVSIAAFPRGLALTPYNVEFRMSGNSTSTPSYASMSCTWTLCLHLYSFRPDKCLDSIQQMCTLPL